MAIIVYSEGASGRTRRVRTGGPWLLVPMLLLALVLVPLAMVLALAVLAVVALVAVFWIVRLGWALSRANRPHAVRRRHRPVTVVEVESRGPGEPFADPWPGSEGSRR